MHNLRLKLYQLRQVIPISLLPMSLRILSHRIGRMHQVLRQLLHLQKLGVLLHLFQRSLYGAVKQSVFRQLRQVPPKLSDMHRRAQELSQLQQGLRAECGQSVHEPRHDHVQDKAQHAFQNVQLKKQRHQAGRQLDVLKQVEHLLHAVPKGSRRLYWSFGIRFSSIKLKVKRCHLWISRKKHQGRLIHRRLWSAIGQSDLQWKRLQFW